MLTPDVVKSSISLFHNIPVELDANTDPKLK